MFNVVVATQNIHSVYACLHLSIHTATNCTEEVMGEVNILADSWQKILMFLHLPSLMKSSIAAAHPTDPSACLRTVIVLWLQREYDVKQYGSPSWRALVQAVADPAGGNDSDLADSIAEKYPDKRHRVRFICTRTLTIMVFYLYRSKSASSCPPWFSSTIK